MPVSHGESMLDRERSVCASDLNLTNLISTRQPISSTKYVIYLFRVFLVVLFILLVVKKHIQSIGEYLRGLQSDQMCETSFFKLLDQFISFPSDNAMPGIIIVCARRQVLHDIGEASILVDLIILCKTSTIYIITLLLR